MGCSAGVAGRERAGMALALLTVALATGCGDDGDTGGSGEAAALLEQAASKQIESAEMHMRVGADVPGFPILGSVLSLEVDGPIAAGGSGELPELDWNALLKVGGQELAARLRAVDDGAYVTFQGLDYEADPELVAQAAAAKGDGDGLTLAGQLGIDPTAWLTDLRVEEGDEIGGDATRVVTGDVDVGAVLDDLLSASGSSGLRDRLERLGQDPVLLELLSDDVRDRLAEAVDRAEVGIAIDEQGYARGVSAALEFTVPDDLEGVQVEGGKIELDVVLEQLGVDVDVRPPPNPAPLSELLRLARLIFGIEELSDLWSDPTP